jgi:hypothetical protein
MSDEFMEKHREYSLYMDYPPFSTSMKKTEEYREDCKKEIKRIFSLSDEEKEDARMFSTVAAKWADDLDEARLYQKRYGDSLKGKEEAQKVVYKMENRIEAIRNNTDEDALLNFGFAFLDD